MKKLIFKEANINYAPGVDVSHHLEYSDDNAFSEGINLVVGPNGVGKSTTAKALQAVLFGGKNYNVNYTIDLDGDAISGETVKGVNQTVTAHVPADRQGKSFIMSLEDLLEIGAAETADMIYGEAYGGARLDNLGGGDNHRNTRNQARARNQRSNELNEKLTEYAGFASIEDELKARKNDRKNLQAKQGNISALDALKTYRNATLDRRTAELAADPFPPEIRHVSREDADELETLYPRISSSEAELVEKRQELNRLEAELSGAPVEQSDIDLSVSIHSALLTHERELESAKRELAGEEEREKSIRAKLGTIVERDIDYPALKERLSDQLDTRLSRYHDAKAKAAAADEVVEQLSSIDSQRDAGMLKRCDEGLTCLINWLAATGTGTTINHKSNSGSILISAVLCVLLALGLFIVHWSSLLMLVPAAILFYSFFTSRQADTAPPEPASGPDLKTAYQSQYNGLSLKPIDSWSEQTVRSAVRELREQISILEAAERVHDKKELAVAQQEKAHKDLADCEADLAELRTILGLEPGQDPEITRLIVKTLIEWQTATTTIAELKGSIFERENQIAEHLKNANAVFGPALNESAANAMEVQAYTDKLRDRLSTQEERERLATTEIPNLEQRLDNDRQTRDRILGRLNLEEDTALATVRDWMRDFEPAKKAFTAVDQARQAEQLAESTLNAKLATLPEEVATELRALDDDELEDQLTDASSLSDNITKLTEEIKDLEHKLDALQDPKELLAAEQAVGAAHSAFLEHRDWDIAALVRNKMVELLKQRCESEASPTLQRASELFSQFTNDAYSLTTDSSGKGLVVVTDTNQHAPKRYNELSSGTRVQMLLAARMAFLEQLENQTGARLPLFLDEVLCNSDDSRMSAIIETVLKIAQERQVFYFTAQLDEIEKWKELAEGKADIKEHVLPFSNDGQMDAILPAPVSEPGPPAPSSGESWEDYVLRLGFKAMEPLYDTMDGLHIWHMVHDAQKLHSCLQAHIETWGQFQRRCERLGPEKFCAGLDTISPEDLERIESVAECLDTMWSKWWIGRGRPLDYRALEQCGVTGAYINDVYDRCKDPDVNFDAQKLIASMWNDKIGGVGPGTIRKYEDGFKTHDYIKDEDVLSQEEFADELAIFIQNSPASVRDYLRSVRDWFLELFQS